MQSVKGKIPGQNIGARNSGGRLQGGLPERAFEFAASILEVIDKLPNNTKGWVLGKQLLRSASSVGANVLEANEALSRADFIHKCSLARKEAAETRYWLALCQRGGLLESQTAQPLMAEADELVRILASIVKKSQAKPAAREFCL